MHLRFRGTFIEASPSDSDGSSPRGPSSDPGSICSREAAVSSTSSSFFQREKAYVTNLSQSLRQPQASPKSTDAQNTDSGLDGSADLSSEDGVPSHLSRSRSFGSYGSSLSQIPEASSPQKRFKQKLVHQNIRQKAGSVAEANDLAAWQRISPALTSIQEIPEQVEQVLRQRATDVMYKMHDEVAIVRDVIDSDCEDGHGDAKRSVAVIPDLVMDSFSANIARAMSSVRYHVEGVMSTLEADAVGGALDGNTDHARVMQKIQDIPIQVRQIAADAVEKAVEDSQEQVVHQLGQARCSLPKRSPKKAMIDAEHRALERAEEILAGVPRALPSTALEDPVTQILDTVQKTADGSLVRENALPNRDVVDALLRGKAGDYLAGPSAETLRNGNPGSVGHPELCSRPCLFFNAGQCSNGLSCLFCHATHPRRAAHLDKRNRSLLQKMDLVDRFTLIAPILRQKLNIPALRVHCGLDILQHLDHLCEEYPEPTPSPQHLRSRQARDGRSLSVALQCMTARSLLALLSNTPVCKDSPKHQSVMQFLTRVSSIMRPDDERGIADTDSQGRASLEDVPETRAVQDSPHSSVSTRTPHGMSTGRSSGYH